MSKITGERVRPEALAIRTELVTSGDVQGLRLFEEPQLVSQTTVFEKRPDQ